MKKHSIVPAPVHQPGTRILTLSLAHFMVDLLGGTLPGVLPVALAYFKLNLGLGVVILTSMSIGCNMMQIPAALLDRHRRTPRLLALGLIMAGLIVLLAALPETTPFFLICLLMIIVGAGIAIVHPLGLRGTQHITEIAPGVTTSAFMTCGFFGSAVGPWISALLVSGFGLKGLYFLLIPTVLVILALRFTNVKLAVDRAAPAEAEKKPESSATESPWSFSALMAEATRYIGYPYVWGGSSPDTSFDCSGYICWVYTRSGVYHLSRTTAQGIYDQCAIVSREEARPGDLVFFTGTYASAGAVSHVGIYVGGSRMLHCGSPIGYADLTSPYWNSHLYAFGRLATIPE